MPCSTIHVLLIGPAIEIMNVCSAEEDDQSVSDRLQVDKGSEETNQEEFDFVGQPSEDFFCPVTFELLLNPHQTTCCGHHLSEKAVNRLQREGKPCPMCKESKLVTMPDKFFKRKASAVLIRCPYKESECEWVGEVGRAKQHIAACPKRPWECHHCDFTSTFDVGIRHVEQCTKYPVPCPNKCEVGTVPRCDMEKHHMECPLKPVACQFADVGCSVKVARRDLKRHMEESQQQHLLSATLLNLKLTRETIVEKDRLLALKEQQLADLDQKLTEKERQLAEKELQVIGKDYQIAIHQAEIADKDNQLAKKDHQIAEQDAQLTQKDHQIVEKDHQIADKDKQLAKKECQLAEKDRMIADKDHQLAEKDNVIAMKDDRMLGALAQIQQHILEFTEFTCHVFTLEKFSEYQKHGLVGDWYSEPFSSQPGNYEVQLNVETKCIEQGHDYYMKIRLKRDNSMAVGTDFIIGLQLLNQQRNRSHYFRMLEASSGIVHTSACDYIQFKELYKRDEEVQYLKDDCLKFVLWIKTKKLV